MEKGSEIFHEPVVVEEQPEAEPEILSEPVIEEAKIAVTAEPEVFQEAAVEEPELIEEEIIEEILESKEEPIIEPEAVKIQEKPVENTEIFNKKIYAMITKIELKGFKSYVDYTFELKPLTILTG